MNSCQNICRETDALGAEFIELSHRIWSNPELAYNEFCSSRFIIDCMKKNGFEIETGLAGIPTAFKAVYGSGKPVIGFLGEYDALPNLSQHAGVEYDSPLVPGGNGHGCGHNALGAGTALAVAALKNHMERHKVPGTIIFFGCPAEERGCGKSFMARAGVFDGVDAAVCWHPDDLNRIVNFPTLANIQVNFTFEGRPAHASACPEKGRSALDAAELMNIGVQFLREHVPQTTRIHYAFQDAGGSSPNVVQSFSKLLYYIRCPKSVEAKEIFERVVKIAQGAALMTETELHYKIESGMTEFIPSQTLSRLAASCWKEIGACEYSAEAHEIADRFSRYLGEPLEENITSEIPEYVLSDIVLPASTDVGDVSFNVPTVMLMASSYVKGTTDHSRQLCAQVGSAVGDNALVHIAKVMAYTALKVLENRQLADEAKAELIKATGGVYECLIPEDVQPDIPETIPEDYPCV